jgi:hypothetical protein
MAKKKKNIDYSSENITFVFENKKEKLMRYNPNLQVTELKCLEEGSKGTHEVAFAHLPKEIKELIRPLK